MSDSDDDQINYKDDIKKSKIYPKNYSKNNYTKKVSQELDDDDDEDDLEKILKATEKKNDINKMKEKSIELKPGLVKGNFEKRKSSKSSESENSNFVGTIKAINKEEIMKNEFVDIEEEEENLAGIENINFNNFTDDIIEKFFKNNDNNSEDFFLNFAHEMESNQKIIDQKLKSLIKEDESNNKKLNDTKQEFIKELNIVKEKNKNFEVKVGDLNELYLEKLSYISLISKNLFEFEKYKNNINYAVKVFDYIELLNKVDNMNEIELPVELSLPEKILLGGGVEIYLAFKEILETLRKTNKYNNFIKNFQSLETKIQNTIIKSIAQNYEENNLEKLQSILRITEVIHNDLLINLYISYILNDVLKLNGYIDSLKKIEFKIEGVSEEKFTNLINICNNFHEALFKGASEQFGTEYSKIYILFPENKQVIVINSMITEIIKKLSEFRKVLIKEENKNEETCIRIIEYIYPKSLQFNEQLKQMLYVTKRDLISSLEQETNIFLTTLEGIYMSKERNLLELFITSSYKNKIGNLNKKTSELTINLKNKKLKANEYEIMIKDNLKILGDMVNNTSFSILIKKTENTINRYTKLIKNKEERQDLIESFCKEVFDSVQNLLIEYYKMHELILQECINKSIPMKEVHFYLFAKLNYCKSQFREIFIHDLKDFFTSINFYEPIEEYINKCINNIDTNCEKDFNSLSSYTNAEYNKILDSIKYKETYKIKITKEEFEKDETSTTEECNKIISFITPILIVINENWNGLDKYKNMVYLLFTNMTVEKIKEILLQSKINKIGVAFMENDFQKIAKTYAQYIDDKYSKQIYEIIFLTEIFTTDDNDLKELIKKLETEDKYETDLIKVIVKKRKDAKS